MSLLNQNSIRNQVAPHLTDRPRSRTIALLASLVSLAWLVIFTPTGEAQSAPQKPAQELTPLTPIEALSSEKTTIKQTGNIENGPQGKKEMLSPLQEHLQIPENRQILRPVEERPVEERPVEERYAEERPIQPEEIEAIKQIRQQIGSVVQPVPGSSIWTRESGEQLFEQALHQLNPGYLPTQAPQHPHPAPTPGISHQFGDQPGSHWEPQRSSLPQHPVHSGTGHRLGNEPENQWGLQQGHADPRLWQNHPPSGQPGGQPGVHPVGPANPLRHAARELEALAANLENLHCYDEADELRDQARRLWKKAR